MIRKSSNSPVSESAFPGILRELALPFGDKVELEVKPVQAGNGMRMNRAGFVVKVRWKGLEFAFLAESKIGNTPRVVEEAIRQARGGASAAQVMPMVIVPYLDESKLQRLWSEEVSGIDLCGNAAIIVPGRLLLWRSGQPNRYPDSRAMRFAYRGTTSIVPRVFLSRPRFPSVNAVQKEISDLGGFVVLSTVSKALKQMEDDVVIERTREGIVLLQPDKLLDLLADSFRPPKSERVIQGKLKTSLPALFARIQPSGPAVRLALSGASSQVRYAAGMRADEFALYCDNLDSFRERVGDLWQESERYAGVTVIETRELTPFFDARRDESAVVYASPLQTYLELMGNGEKRDREIAGQVRERILRDLRNES